MKCKAVQYSDQMACDCGNVWDMNDPYPPECRAMPDPPAALHHMELCTGTIIGSTDLHCKERHSCQRYVEWQKWLNEANPPPRHSRIRCAAWVQQENRGKAMTDYKLGPKSIVDELAQFIRQVDGDHRMGAGALAEKICERFRVDAPAVQEGPPRHPATPSFFEYPSFEESADFDPEPAQQPEERETPGSYPISGQIFFRESSNEWVLELTGSVNGTIFAARHTQPADTCPEDVAGLPTLHAECEKLRKDAVVLKAALEGVQIAATHKSIRTGIQAGVALGLIAALCDFALAACRKQGGEA